MQIIDLENHRLKIRKLRDLLTELEEATAMYGSINGTAGSGVKSSSPSGNPAVEKTVDRKLILEQRIAALETETESEWRAWEPEMDTKLSSEEKLLMTLYFHYALKWNTVAVKVFGNASYDPGVMVHKAYRWRDKALKKLA